MTNEEKTIQKDYDFLTLNQLMAKVFPQAKWLVEGLIPSGSTIVLSGSPASYKTWLILDIAIKIASGAKLFDKFNTSQAKVLIMDEESGEEMLQTRLKELGADASLPIYSLSNIGFKLTEDQTNKLIGQCIEYDIKFVIFDSLVRIHSKDENDASSMARVADQIKKFNAKGIGVLFTHHNRKPGANSAINQANEMRGSSDILASVDCHLSNMRNDDSLTITQTKLRHRQELPAFRVGIISEEGSFRFEYQGAIEERVSKLKMVQKIILEHVAEIPPNSTLYKGELYKILRSLKMINCGHSTFKQALDVLLETGELIASKGQKNQVMISLPEPSNG